VLGWHVVADEVRVDPHVLETAVGVCGDLHAEVTRDEAGVEPATVAAAHGLPGWYTNRALEDLVWWWRDDLTKLGTYLDRLGEAFHACALDYGHADRASAGNFDIRGR
jgi:hypothetical protein